MSPRFFSSGRQLAAVGLALAGLSCSRPQSGGLQLPPPSVERIAIFPIENLTSQPELAGAASAVALLLDWQLSGLQKLAPVLVATASQATAQQTTRELRGYLEPSRNGYELKLHDRAPGGKLTRVIVAKGNSLAAVSEDIARQIATERRPLPKGIDQATAVFAQALAAPPSAGIAQMQQAAQLAPGFGLLAMELGVRLWNSGQHEQAIAVWQGTLRHTGVDALSKARIRAEIAQRANPADLSAALVALAALLPAEPELQFRAGEALLHQRRFAEAAQRLTAAVAEKPADGAYRNLLAYAQALAGQPGAAQATIAVRQQLEPGNLDPIDSKGEIEFLTGQYAQAATTFESIFHANPRFLDGFEARKAIEAHLRAGNVDAAAKLADQWTSLVPKGSPIAERIRAIWDHRRGEHRAAIERLAGATEESSLAHAIVWLLQEGDRTRAALLASESTGPATPLLRYVAAPSAGAQEWSARASAAFPQPQMTALRQTALEFALALDGKWSDVAALLASQEPISPLRNPQKYALYRKALEKSGQAEALKKLPTIPPLPTMGGDGLFDCVIYAK